MTEIVIQILIAIVGGVIIGGLSYALVIAVRKWW